MKLKIGQVTSKQRATVLFLNYTFSQEKHTHTHTHISLIVKTTRGVENSFLKDNEIYKGKEKPIQTCR